MKTKNLKILLIVLIFILLLYCVFLALNKQKIKKQDNDTLDDVSYQVIDLDSDEGVVDSYNVQNVRLFENNKVYYFTADLFKVSEDDRKIKKLKIIFLSANNEDLYEDIITFDGSEYYPLVISRQLENNEKLSLTKSIKYELEYE